MVDVEPKSVRPVLSAERPWIPWWLILVGLLIAVRFLHFGPILDGPHQWRQADTAFCAYGFYKYDFNILHPSVCWRGTYRLCALEFPIHEFIVAILYRVFGPHLAIARLVTLAFFAGSAWYLYLVVRYIAEARLAQIATVFYCAFPLGMVYSRAVHIDFSVVFFAHATLYYLLQACDRPGLLYPFLAGVTGTCAWIVKVPYVFYLYLPLACYALRPPWDIRKFLRLAVPSLIAMFAFFAWRDYSYRINAAVPDWPYVNKMVNLDDWYFGTLRQRQSTRNWIAIGRHLYEEVFCRYGLLLLIPGILGVSSERRHRWLWWCWLVGVTAYVLIFFNLNRQHDYYQIPFLAISAIFMAFGIVWSEDRLKARMPRRKRAIRTCTNTLALAAAGCFAWFSSNHVPAAYWVDELLQRAGAVIQQRTPEDALLLASIQGQTETNMPLLLYAGGRLGWSLPGPRALEPGVLDEYKKAGATWWVIVMDQPFPKEILARFHLPDPYTEYLGRKWWLNMLYLGPQEKGEM